MEDGWRMEGGWWMVDRLDDGGWIDDGWMMLDCGWWMVDYGLWVVDDGGWMDDA